MYESTLAPEEADARPDPYGAHYRINRCQLCGLVYSSPIFDANEIRILYTHSPHTNVVGGEEANVRHTMQLYYELAQPFLPARDRFLDIGCDVGLLLDIARQDAFRELYGIEPVPQAASVARRVPGAVISSEFYEDQVFPDAYFDLISLIHVVDHLVNPIEVLQRVWVQLKPRGVVLAVVHNSGSMVARVLGERFPPYNLYHHYFFNKSTLRRLFERSGFEVLRVVSTFNCYSLGFLVQKMPGIPTSLKQISRRTLDGLHLGGVPLTVPLGNIGIVARRPP